MDNVASLRHIIRCGESGRAACYFSIFQLVLPPPDVARRTLSERGARQERERELQPKRSRRRRLDLIDVRKVQANTRPIVRRPTATIARSAART